jgi:tetratricopeptide (TPR) repeat protein
MTDYRGGIVLLAMLAGAGCASQGELNIRPVGRQAAAVGEPVSARVALAQGQLALGNVALALEGFRRAERDEPGSVAALSGMAECYRQMGRTDLSQRYYEQALAVAPEKPQLYLALARTLDGDGQATAAQSLRNEAAARTADKAAPVTTATGSVAILPTPVAAGAPAASVTITLPPARPIARKLAGEASHARLERLSTGEVALVTSGKSPWAAQKVAASPRSVTVQFARRDAMVVLNGARIAGIAARTRDYLAARGFAGAQIGNAKTPQAQSLIKYPATARVRALRIAAQFAVAPKLEASDGPLTLIVGRDARKAGRIG